MSGGNASWMQVGSGNALGQLSNGNSCYEVIKMTPLERKRRSLFEDFRSRLITQSELKIKLAALHD